MLTATVTRVTSSVGDILTTAICKFRLAEGGWALGQGTGSGSCYRSSRAALGEHQPGGHFAAWSSGKLQMLRIALCVILFINKPQFDTDECCADLCLSLPAPFSNPHGGAGLRRQAQPSCSQENWQIESDFTDCPEKSAKKSKGREAAAWGQELTVATSPRTGTSAELPAKARANAAPQLHGAPRLGRWSTTCQTSAENFLQINESHQCQGSALQQPACKARLSAFKLTAKPDVPL